MAVRNIEDTRSYYSAFFQGNSSLSATANSALMDISSMTMPDSLTKLFPLLEYYATMDCTISPLVQKISLYPIMPLDFSKIRKDTVRKSCKTFFEDVLNIYAVLSVLSLNYNIYGRSFASLSFPFRRVFTCKKCQKNIYSDFVVDFEFIDFKFFFKCPHCGDHGVPKDFFDFYINDRSRVHFILWRPHDIEFIYSQFSGEYQFFYKAPDSFVSMMKKANKFVLDRTPKFIIESLKNKDRIVFREGEIFGMFRPDFARNRNISPEGLPLILNALPPAYLKKVFSKASEVSGVLKASPASVIYPETNPGAGQYGNPLTTIGMETFSAYMREEIKRHRDDPGYVLISPSPIGQQNLFGDAKQYHYFQEMKFQEQDIVQGLGFPREFLDAGLTFGLASVPARVLENQMQKQIYELVRFLRWAKEKLSNIFPLGDEEIGMKRFKMADDLNLLQMQMTAAAQGDLSKGRIWESVLNVDYEEELKRVREEDAAKFPSFAARIMAETAAQLKAVEMQRNFEANQKVEDARQQAMAQVNNPNETYLQQMTQNAQVLSQQAMQYKMLMEQMETKNKDLERQIFQQNRLAEKELHEKNKLNVDIQKNQQAAVNATAPVEPNLGTIPEQASASSSGGNETIVPIVGDEDPRKPKIVQLSEMISSPQLTNEAVSDILEQLIKGSRLVYYNVIHGVINNGNINQERFNVVIEHFNQNFSSLQEEAGAAKPKAKATGEASKKEVKSTSKPSVKTESKPEKKPEVKK